MGLWSTLKEAVSDAAKKTSWYSLRVSDNWDDIEDGWGYEVQTSADTDHYLVVIYRIDVFYNPSANEVRATARQKGTVAVSKRPNGKFSFTQVALGYPMEQDALPMADWESNDYEVYRE